MGSQQVKQGLENHGLGDQDNADNGGWSSRAAGPVFSNMGVRVDASTQAKSQVARACCFLQYLTEAQSVCTERKEEYVTDEEQIDTVPLATFIDEMMAERELSDKEVCLRMGYGNPAIVRSFREGRVKVPLDKIPDLANAIGTDRAALMDRALREYMPATVRALMISYSGFTDNELEIIGFIRELSGNSDPELDEGIRESLRALLSTRK